MEPVDVLGDHRLQLAPGFQLGQGQMRGVGFGVQGEHLVLIEAVKLGGVLHKEGMDKMVSGGIGILLVVEAVLAAKVGDSRLGGAARSTKNTILLLSAIQFRKISSSVMVTTPPPFDVYIAAQPHSGVMLHAAWAIYNCRVRLLYHTAALRGNGKCDTIEKILQGREGR